MRIVFMGTPEFAVPSLSAIVSAGYNVVAAFSQPPRPYGRGMASTPSPVHWFAEQAGIDVHTPDSFAGAAEQKLFAGLQADIAIVVAYGLILPKPVLDAPRLGCLNLHASLLPRWRGAAPIQRAIMAGDKETGVMVMRMEEELDTGPVCMAEKVAIGPDATSGDLHDLLAQRGADLLVRALAAASRDALDCEPQSGEASYAQKIDKAEARIDFSLPAGEVHNRIRGLSPFPGAWFEAEIGGRFERVKVLGSTLAKGQGAPGTLLDGGMTVACGKGAIALTNLQRAGKKALPADEFRRGAAMETGVVLG
jgi:methionyl-tRNA formyltransferase